MENTVLDALTTFSSTVVEAFPLGTIAAVIGLAITAPLSIYFFRWGANLIVSKVRSGLRGRM